MCSSFVETVCSRLHNDEDMWCMEVLDGIMLFYSTTVELPRHMVSFTFADNVLIRKMATGLV